MTVLIFFFYLSIVMWVRVCGDSASGVWRALVGQAGWEKGKSSGWPGWVGEGESAVCTPVQDPSYRMFSDFSRYLI